MGLEVPQEKAVPVPSERGSERAGGLLQVTQSGGTGTGPGSLGSQAVVLGRCRELCFLFLVICDELVSLEE